MGREGGKKEEERKIRGVVQRTEQKISQADIKHLHSDIRYQYHVEKEKRRKGIKGERNSRVYRELLSSFVRGTYTLICVGISVFVFAR